MRAKNFISIVLILALCFGQVAVKVHAVGHLQLHDGHAGTVVDGLWAERGACLGLESPAHQHGDHPGHHDHNDSAELSDHFCSVLADAHDENNSAYDNCDLYHVLLGFSGIASNSAIPLAIAKRQTLNVRYFAPAHFKPLVKATGIRAPPYFS